VYLGARRIRAIAFPGHTGSDAIVLIPDSKVAFAGDLFWRLQTEAELSGRKELPRVQP
jgi:glyoxylase-like metal-dependent hydrolase (beta-lactamase superfamily II)